MSKEEIQEGNKLIAIFMGWEKKNGSLWVDESDKTIVQHLKPKCTPDGWMFHESWSWLMPVVEHIQRDYSQIAHLSEYGDAYYGVAATVAYHGLNRHAFHYFDTALISHALKEEDDQAALYGKKITDHQNTVCGSKMEAIWRAVIQFIRWYNTQTIKTT